MGKWGFFITIEGIEGSGKTTLAESLFAELKNRGFPVFLTWEPGGTETGEKIRKILLHSKELSHWTELLLFLASRKEHVEKKILPALREGKIVISDRFDDSTVAYQCFGRGLNLRIVKRINKIVTSGLKPNLTFLLDIEPELSLKRLKRRDRIEREDLDFHKRVRQGYLTIAGRSKKRIIVIDGELKKEKITEIAFSKVIERLKDKGKFISLIKSM
ncbi:MAG: dTMP kinase [Candidatus Hydrothermales bacterium]